MFRPEELWLQRSPLWKRWAILWSSMGFGRNLALADIHTSKRPANIILESSGLFRIFAENCHFDKNIFFWYFQKVGFTRRVRKNWRYFLKLRLPRWSHTSKFNFLQVVWDIRSWIQVIILIVLKMPGFWKKRAKLKFSALANNATFGKVPKITWFWKIAVIKPFQIQKFLAHP